MSSEPSFWTRFAQWWSGVEVFDFPLFTFGGKPFTILSLIVFLALLALLLVVAGRLQRLLADRWLMRTHLDRGMRQAVASIIRYVFLVTGFLVIVQAFGINLTTLNVLAGAIGVGIGFGTQNIIQNWVSGIIVMFERPVRVGDRIQVAGVEGDITEIGARRTTIVGNDNRAVIVPNSKLITETVVNWQYYCAQVALRIAIAVAPGSDPRLVERLLRETAKESQDLLAEPAAVVNLLDMSGSALKFEMIVWTQRADLTNEIVSRLNFAIHDRFAGHDIKMA
jgi:small-conductance mechanosensitive channel